MAIKQEFDLTLRQKRALLKWWWSSFGVHTFGPDLSDERKISLVPEKTPSKTSESLIIPKKENVLIESEVIKPAAEKSSLSPVQAGSLEELRKAVESFEGCALKACATHTVFGVGAPHAPVMIMGEAPGAEEDRLGQPFVGMSGRLLDKMLGSVGLSREKNVYISNVVFWRPPGNRPPTTEEIAACWPFVERHVQLIQPKILVLLGASACRAFFSSTTIALNKMRGKWHSHDHRFGSIPLWVTYHPAFLLRAPDYKRHAYQDWLAVKDRLKTLELV